MLFSPVEYTSISELNAAYHWAASGLSSDTLIDNKEVFGYVDGQPYAAIEIYDRESDEYYIIAGDAII